MAEFITKCPHCGGELQVQDEWIGMDLECPLCKKHFTLSAETPKNDPDAVFDEETEDFEKLYIKAKLGSLKKKLIAVAPVVVILVIVLISCTASRTYQKKIAAQASKASQNKYAELEKNAVSVVNDILRSNNDFRKCLSVTVRYSISIECYKADAKLDDGKTLEITINDRTDSIVVSVDAYVEQNAISVVNDIIKDRTDAKCVSVKIVETLGFNAYKAEAKLDDGRILNISIDVYSTIIRVTVNE